MPQDLERLLVTIGDSFPDRYGSDCHQSALVAGHVYIPYVDEGRADYRDKEQNAYFQHMVSC
jgi:hypothetical protein